MKYRIEKVKIDTYEYFYYPQYRKWFKWHQMSDSEGNFCYSSIISALNAIQSKLNLITPKSEIIEVNVINGIATKITGN